MNNVNRAQMWVVSMIILGMILLVTIENAEGFGIWYREWMLWSIFISLFAIALYIMLLVMVTEYFLWKDGYELYIRSKW